MHALLVVLILLVGGLGNSSVCQQLLFSLEILIYKSLNPLFCIFVMQDIVTVKHDWIVSMWSP